MFFAAIYFKCLFTSDVHFISFSAAAEVRKRDLWAGDELKLLSYRNLRNFKTFNYTNSSSLVLLILLSSTRAASQARRRERCWNNVHGTWWKSVMHKTPWRRKQENLFVETFFHAFSPDYHLALAHKFNKFSSFLDEEENGWSDKESSSSICLWNLLFFTRDEDGMKWIDVNLSLRALVEDFFCLFKSTLSATTNHRNSVLAFFPEEKGGHGGNHQMLPKRLQKIIHRSEG